MAKYTQAYSAFLGRLNEVSTLQRIAKSSVDLRGAPASLDRSSALCRSGIVLLCGHIEGYVEDLCELILDRIYSKRVKKVKLDYSFAYYCSQDIIKQIQKTTEPKKVAEKVRSLITRDLYIWDSQSEFFDQPLPADRFIRSFSNPKPEKIYSFINRFGYTDLRPDLMRELRADFALSENMVNQVVDQRHKIAHGDVVTASTPSDLGDMITYTQIFCRATDKLVANWCAFNGWKIR